MILLIDHLCTLEKSKGPKIKHLGTPALIEVNEDLSPFIATLCFLSFQNSCQTLGTSPDKPFCCNFNVTLFFLIEPTQLFWSGLWLYKLENHLRSHVA